MYEWCADDWMFGGSAFFLHIDLPTTGCAYTWWRPDTLWALINHSEGAMRCADIPFSYVYLYPAPGLFTWRCAHISYFFKSFIPDINLSWVCWPFYGHFMCLFMNSLNCLILLAYFDSHIFKIKWKDMSVQWVGYGGCEVPIMSNLMPNFSCSAKSHSFTTTKWMHFSKNKQTKDRESSRQESSLLANLFVESKRLKLLLHYCHLPVWPRRGMETVYHFVDSSESIPN